MKTTYLNLRGTLRSLLAASFFLMTSVGLWAQTIGEVFTLSWDQANSTTWYPVTTVNTYTSPVVVMGPLSSNDADPAVLRVRNVAASSFQYQMDEWEYLDGAHATEAFRYLVVEEGSHTLAGGGRVDAGAQTSVTNGVTTVSFGSAFSAAPVVLAQCASDNEATAVIARISNVTTTGFDVELQEESGEDGIHAAETVNWVAFETGVHSGSGVSQYEATVTAADASQDFVTKTFAQDYGASPALVGDLQSMNGNNPVELRYQSLTGTSVDFKADEEGSNGEVIHVAESVGYVVFGGIGSLTAEGGTGGDPFFEEELFNDAANEFGNWIDGGADARYHTGGNVIEGSGSVFIRDDSSTSYIRSADLPLDGASEARFDFSYRGDGLVSGDNFSLQISVGGGAYQNVATYNFDPDIGNGSTKTASETITGFALDNQTRFRLIADATSNPHKIYLDEIRIYADFGGTGPIAVTGVSVTPPAATVDAGTTVTLNAAVSPVDADNPLVNWASSDPLIAEVDAFGVVSGLSSGSVTITATTVDGGFTDTAAITVNVPVTGVSVTPSTTTVDVGSTVTLNAAVSPAGASDPSVQWDSSDSLIAEVDAFGVVRGLIAGSVTITATTVDGGFTDTSAITVNAVGAGATVSNRWQFNGDANDSVGTANGIFQGGANASGAGVEGSGALVLDGVDDWVNIDNVSLEDGFTDYSLSLWFKADALGGDQYLFEEGGGTNGIALRLNGSTLEAAVADSGVVQVLSQGGLSNGTWYFAALTYANGSLTLYLDGASAGTLDTGFAAIGNHGNPAAIGAVNGSAPGHVGDGFYFDGTIDDVRVYSEAVLSGSEVSDLYDAFDPGPGGPGVTAVQLPIEVIGPAGLIETVSVDLGASGSSADKLWLLVNNLSYDGKASVQVNGGGWISLENRGAGITIPEPDRSYGGIGGGFSTMNIFVDSADFVNGVNTIDFRFNFTDGISAGYRVVKFNVRSGTTDLLPASAFVEDVPSTWTAPIAGQAAIDAGKVLWETKELTVMGAPINSKCMDCHTASGMDLKYFAYSNKSIIARSEFHGLTTTEGQQIASYIRTLPFDAPANGRPWNPPFQPGPGLDSGTAFEWPAGAGLDAVLDTDAEMMPHIFGGGTRAEIDAATDVDSDLNVREMPIAVQFPDWKHWLPRIGVSDIWYNFEAELPYRSYLDTHVALEDGGAATLAAGGQLINTVDAWGKDVGDWLAAGKIGHPWEGVGTNVTNRDDQGITSERAKFNLAKWNAVKHFELAMEYDTLGLSAIDRPGKAELYQFPSTRFITFNIAAHFIGDNRGTSSFLWEEYHFPQEYSEKPEGYHDFNWGNHLGTYWSSVWYQLQMTMAAGQHKGLDVEPVDWAYSHQHVNLLTRRTGIKEPLRLYQNLIKCYQQRNLLEETTPIGKRNWNMREVSPWRYYSDYDGVTDNHESLNDIQPNLWPDVVSSMLANFVKRSNRWPVSHWPRTDNKNTSGTQNWWKVELDEAEGGPSMAIVPFDVNPHTVLGGGFIGVWAESGAQDAVECDAMATLSRIFSNSDPVNDPHHVDIDYQVLLDFTEWCNGLWPSHDWTQYR